MTVHIPGDYPTIQAGIDACVNGDKVLIADAAYAGDVNRDINFGGRAIVVMSENGPDVTIIDCGGISDRHRGFEFNSGEDSSRVVSDFTITGGYHYSGGGIYSVNFTDVKNSIIWDNHPGQISGSMRVVFSDVEGGYSGEGNINTDPFFITFHGFDYLLKRTSPCIDAGDPTIEDGKEWPEWYDNGTRSDMGAYGGPGNVGWLR